MKVLPDALATCVKNLAAAFPVEDIWLLERGDGGEWLFAAEKVLVVFVPEGEMADEREELARDTVRASALTNTPEVHVLPLTALERVPRPLIAKLALTRGQRVYCR